jgi:hypothetical protein
VKQSVFDSDALHNLKRMLPGDIRQEKFVHYEDNCCTDENGHFQRDICVDNVTAAIVSAGLLCDHLADVPSKNRWGSLSEHESEQALGEMYHRIHPRVLEESFGDCGQPDDPEGDDDYRAMMRGKCYRATMAANAPDAGWQLCLRNWIMGPIDHLWMALQALDETGNTYADINWPETDPIETARQAVAHMVLQDVSNGIAGQVFHQYEPSGDAVETEMLTYSRHLGISIDSQVSGKINK